MQNKSVTLPINNNRHSTRTWEEINKKEKLHRHHSHSMGKHKNRLSSIIYCLLSIATSLLPSECCWNVCVCVCGLFSFPLSAFFSLLSLSQVVLCWTAPCCCVCISPAGRNSEGIFILFPPFLPGLTDAVCV